MNLVDNRKALELNNIYLQDGFLDIPQCNEMLFQLNPARWEKSKVAKIEESGGYIEFHSPARTSEVYHASNFNPRFKEMVNFIENRLSGIKGFDDKKIESWQLNKYGFGNKFEAHVDCGLWKDSPSGEREKTILIYLLPPSKGGATYFRAINQYVTPVSGRLVIWNNLMPNGNCNYAMIHGGLPVEEGLKVTLNTWQRQHSIIKTQ